MGQYYQPAMLIDGEIRVFDTKYDGERQGSKLTEHSWIGNRFLDAIADKMYMKKVRLVWVGDYSEDESFVSEFSSAQENEIVTFEDVWRNLIEEEEIETTNFRLEECIYDLYLCNHDSKEYIDLGSYYKRSSGKDRDGEVWCLNPISLLTAVGNGQGGGDYWGVNSELVGSWRWDLISLEPEIPQGYKEDTETMFKEESSFYA